MEKVIAYKSSNNRLFESEEKCLAYEKKLSQYPKVKTIVKKASPAYVVGTYKDVDILNYITETQEKPYSQKRIDRYYIVGGKYKFIDLHYKHGGSVMYGSVHLDGRLSTRWDFGFRRFAEQILLGNELTDDFVKSEVENLNEINKIKLVANVIEPDKKWEIDNPSWQSGLVAPYTFTMEKLD